MSQTFAQLYHLHHSRHAEDLPFWTALALEAGGPVLELGCGTGRVLLPLAQAGSTMIGVDLDREMLQVLRSHASGLLGKQAHVVQADFTRLCLAIRFPLILLPCNTYSTLDGEQRRGTLQAARRMLAPGGKFVLSMPNPAILNRLPRRSSPEVEEVFPHPEDGEPVQVSSSWERGRNDFTLRWDYDHLLPDGQVERRSGTARHHLVPREVYLEEFAAAGFTVQAEYGGFRGEPFAGAAETWVVTLS